ncbi:hypothetical protein [Streptomyces sp. 147326]|uniref:hypothetical protein n=1 Tax=Streptomyces sp. 147326 TaxID=3074379 RepID=UPI003857A539
MTLTLSESAKLSQDQLRRGVIEAFVQESPILDRLPLLKIGSSMRWTRWPHVSAASTVPTARST